MDQGLKKNLLEVCALLEKFEVRYLLVGGAAVALHGYYRHSMGPTGVLAAKPDIDLWYDPTYENYFKVLGMMEALDHDVKAFMDESKPDPRSSFFKLEMDQFTLDLLPTISADVLFNEAYAKKESVELEGLTIHYIGYDDLLKDKALSAREKDKLDIKELKRNRGEEWTPFLETIDGHKFHFYNDQWLMIRASGTEPVLRCYAESDSLDNARKILKACEKAIGA